MIGTRHARLVFLLCISGSFPDVNGWLSIKVWSRPFSRTSLASTDGDLEAPESTTTALASETNQLIWQRLVDCFQGDFDNYQQVVEDRKLGRLPREGGGHENFHCTLIPLSEQSRLAAFYFDGNPERIFRFRYYELGVSESVSSMDGKGKGEEPTLGVEMKLYTLNPVLEGLLRKHSDQPLEWPRLFESFQPGSPPLDKVQYLPKCEIQWSFDRHPVKHKYTVGSIEDQLEETGIHAVMIHGQAIVDSTIIPGVKIRILDQLSLYPNSFYIHDRGFDPETGDFIYGNQRDIPYRLERVSNFVKIGGDPESFERKVTNESLKWTMGPSWRTDEEYQERLDGIGGPSAQMSRGPPAKK